MTASHTFFYHARILRYPQYNRIMAAPSQAINTREYPLYPLRAQMQGTLTFTCPHCGGVTKTRIAYTTYQIRCSNDKCKRKYFGPGIRISECGSGLPPQPPVDTFPLAEQFDYRRARQRLHTFGKPNDKQSNRTPHDLLSLTSADGEMSCDTTHAEPDPAGAD